MLDVNDDTIAAIAKAVVEKLEPILEHKFAAVEGRLATMELLLAPVGGRTIHGIHNKLMVGTDSLERLADSYDRLRDLLNMTIAKHQADQVLQRRIGEFEDRVRGRMAEVERIIAASKDAPST